MRRTSLIIILLTFLHPAFCQFRKYSNEFLNIGAGARGLAMGGSQVATSQDATSGYWNPAGLSAIRENPIAGLMHADYFAGIAKYDFASVIMPLKGSNRTIGFSVLRFAVDDIPNTLFLVEPDGSINYNNIQSFSSADYAFLFSYAQQVHELGNGGSSLSFGVNTKIIHRKVGSFASAWGFGFDAGVQIHGTRWHLGAVAKDITTTFNAWSFNFTEKEKQVLYLTNNDIPIHSTELTAPRVTIGGGYDFRLGKSLKLQAELDADLTFDGRRNSIVSSDLLNVDPHLGLEIAIKDVFFVRTGISNFQRALSDGDTLNLDKVWIYQPSLGAGFKIKNVMIDYAFTNLANQTNPLFTHIFSLRLNFARKEL